MVDTRRFTHDCENCEFHGHMQGYDVYTCRTSMILRHGSDGPEYLSIPLAYVGQVAKRSGGQIWADAIDVVAVSVVENLKIGATSVVPVQLKTLVEA